MFEFFIFTSSLSKIRLGTVDVIDIFTARLLFGFWITLAALLVQDLMSVCAFVFICTELLLP